jgi:N,N'-diacetyllegionaminate synthase
VNAAKKAGADAVKFQTFSAERLVVRGAEKAEYQKKSSGAGESQFEMLKKLELSARDFTRLFAYAQGEGVTFLSTPFDIDSVNLLDELGVAAFKVGSGDITNFPLLRHIAGKKKPVILSTGMATLEEVGEALQVLKKAGARGIVLLHCVSSYPSKAGDMNLKVMETLRITFKLPVGLSDHSPGITIPIAAAALGACIIEKHFTLDKNLPGPDHKASLEPDELKQMVWAIRDVEKAMGNGVKSLTAEEEKTRKLVRRSIVARVDIPEGVTIKEDMLDIKRPGNGIEPKYIDSIIGKIAKKNIKREEKITLSKVV